MEYKPGMEVDSHCATHLARIIPLAHLRRSQFTWVHKRKASLSRVWWFRIVLNSVELLICRLCETWDVHDVNNMGFMCITQFDELSITNYMNREVHDGRSTCEEDHYSADAPV
jgi:hypothetical protein